MTACARMDEVPAVITAVPDNTHCIVQHCKQSPLKSERCVAMAQVVAIGRRGRLSVGHATVSMVLRTWPHNSLITFTLAREIAC